MKSWRDKLQTTLRDVNESSLRLKQQLQQAVQQGPAGEGGLAAAAARVAASPALSPQKEPPQGLQNEEQQYLRLPVESAKKLRWFDKQDINMLMQLHLREKQELFEANSALRQVLLRKGVGDASLEAELAAINRQVDAMRAQEQGVNQVLVLAAQAEVELLREQLDSSQHELQHLRRQRLQTSSSGGLMPNQLPQAQQGAQQLPPAQQQQQAQQQAQREAVGERVSLQLRCRSAGGNDSAAGRPEVAVRLFVRPDYGPIDDGRGMGNSSRKGSPAQDPLASALASLAQATSSSGSAALDPHLLQQAAVALSRLASAHGVMLPGLAPAASGSADSGSAGATAMPAGAAGAGGVVCGPDGAAAMLQARCNELELAVGRLQAELAQAEQDASFARDAAERKLQEQRARFADAQQRQGEVLRLAQDGRLDAESRCNAAERKLEFVEGRCARLEAEAKDLKAEVKKAHQEVKRLQGELTAAEGRVAAAESAAHRERARGVAEVDAKSHELLAQQRSRIAELEAAAVQHQRQLAAARQQAEALESRLTSAELAAAHAAAEVQELEGVAAERDAMAVRLSALEARLDETRAERGHVESYRTLAQQSEEKRARAEDELLTTARLAASLEARLAQAARENEGLRIEVQAAAARVVEAEQSVGRLVAERWQAAGTDRTQWPLAAQEEMENVEARLSALHAALKEAQLQLHAATAAAETARTARTAAERRAAAAEDAAARQQREAELRLQRAEAAASAAAVQVAEFREALAAVERERDRLAAEKQERERAAREAAAAVAAARRRTGSGVLPAAEAGALAPGSMGNSSAGLPSPLPAVKQRSVLEPTDALYLKNVVLKFIDACLSGRSQECEVLLPAVATLLRASPDEYRVLRSHLQKGGSSWLPALMG